MKKIRKNIKMIIGIILGVIISVTTSYVLAATLINSKDVVYQDNMSIGATNVQNAIDGTCSKIDTRLFGIEDKLYTVQNIEGGGNFTSTTTPSYTGHSISIPPNSYCVVSVRAIYSNNAPTGLYLTSCVDQYTGSCFTAEGYRGATNYDGTLTITYAYYNSTDRLSAIYIWTSYNGTASNRVSYNGFCATKVK